MSLGFGLQIFGLITQLTKLTYSDSIRFSVLIFYLVGARGYLNSEQARIWFKMNG